jgi:hypothetical protein
VLAVTAGLTALWDARMSVLASLEGDMKQLGFVCTLAVVGFAAFVWLIPGTAPASDQTAVSVATGAPVTISPLEMQRNTKPSDLPVQYMKGDFM